MWQPNSILAQSPPSCWTQLKTRCTPVWDVAEGWEVFQNHHSGVKTEWGCTRKNSKHLLQHSADFRGTVGGRLIGSALHCCSPNTRYVFTGWDRTNTQSTLGRQNPEGGSHRGCISLPLGVSASHFHTAEFITWHSHWQHPPELFIM